MSGATEALFASHSTAAWDSRLCRWADCTRLLLGLFPFFAMPLWLFPHFADPTRSGRFLLFEFVVCLLLLLEMLPSANRYPRKLDLFHVPLFALGILFLVHMVVDPYLPGAFGRKFEGGAYLHHRYAFYYVVRYGSFLIWTVLIVSRRFGRRFLGQALDLTMIVSIPVAVYAILQFFGHEFLRWEVAEERMRVMSTIGNPLYLADYLAVCILCFVGNLYRKRSQGWLLLSWLAIPILAFALYASSSRGGVISLGFGLCALAGVAIVRLTGSRAWRRVAVFAVAVVVLLSVLGVAVTQLPEMQPLAARFQDALSFSDFSILSRLILWQVSLRQWSLSPWIGIGIEQYRLRHLSVLREMVEDTPGAAAVIRTSRVVAANEAHGDYVQVLTEWGIIGLAFFLLLLVVGLGWSALIAVSRNGRWTRGEQRLSGVLFSIQVALAVEMIYGFQLRLPLHGLLVFSCLAFSAYLWRYPVLTAEKGLGQSWRWGRTLRRLPLAAASVMIAAYVLMVYRAESCGGTARTLLALGKTARAETLIRTAHRLLPEQGELTFLYALTLWEQRRETGEILELFDRALMTSTNTRIPIAKGLLLMRNHRNQEAYRLLQEFAKFRAPLEGLHHARGLVEYLNGNYKEAVNELETEIRLYPRNYEAYLYLATCYRIQGKTGLAIETLKEALSVKRRGLDAHIQLSEIYQEARDYRKAEQEIHEALAIARGIGDFQTVTELSIRLRQLQLEAALE